MAELNPTPAKSVSKHSRKKVALRVDLTAMVDLAFLLITFFMLTTSLAKPRRMEVNMPADGPSAPVPETRTMSLCLGNHNQLIWYMGMADHPLTIPEKIGCGKDLRVALIDKARQIFKASGKDMIVLVKPSDHSVYDTLVETLDELNITAVPTYAIAKISPAEVELLKQKGIY
jgi:biopolymer transport protein ExbD